MKRLKKFLSLLLIGVISVTSVAFWSVSVSAKSLFDDAIPLKPMQLVSFKFDTHKISSEKEGHRYYKIQISRPGTIEMRCEDWYELGGELLNSNGERVCWMDQKYHVEKKGTYYLHICNWGLTGGVLYMNDIHYLFYPDVEPTISLAINMKVNDTIDLTMVTSNYTGKIQWKSSNNSIATINKKKVTAVSKGKCKIYAYLNNGEYQEITIIVRKK